VDVAFKKCASVDCPDPKPLSDFHVRRRSPDGLCRLCKECESKRRKERYSSSSDDGKKDSQTWRAQNRDKVLRVNLDYKRRLRLEAISHYSLGKNICSCCGEKEMEFLTIDHTHGGGNAHRRTIGRGTPIGLWLKKNGYPPGFSILCYNCNCAKGSSGTCPHERALKSP
jgi:hypothetical protein